MAEPGLVCVVDCSKHPDDPGQARYRKLTRAEQAQRRRDTAEATIASLERAYLDLRLTRDALLSATDHLDGKKPWATWRQKLRDLPANTADPTRTRWPKPPAALSCLYTFRALWPRVDWSPLTKGG